MTTSTPEKTMLVGIHKDRLRDELIYRSWKDEAFRQELMADPVAVLQREYSEAFPDGKVPEDLTIKVIAEDKDIMCIVLPQKPDLMTKSEALLHKDSSPRNYIY
jgi:hypothetical protein